jgi:acetyl esterase
MIEPTTVAFLRALESKSGTPPHELSVPEARRQQSEMQAVGAPRPPADVTDLRLPTGPTGEVPVRIVRPADSSGDLPAVLYFHGGGWVVGGMDTHDRLVRELAHAAGAAVVFVDYARSPEARYPVALEQGYAAAAWVAERGRELRLDRSRLAVAGDSSGGNLATAVALLARQRGGPKVASQVLLLPATDAGFDTPSYREFADGPFLTRELMRWFWGQYAPDPAARNEITASPLRASAGQLRGLPPALVITAENDPLRDEGEEYARRLIAAGVEVTATRYLATIHAFVLLDALAGTPAARAAVAQAGAFLKSTLARR